MSGALERPELFPEDGSIAMSCKESCEEAIGHLIGGMILLALVCLGLDLGMRWLAEHPGVLALVIIALLGATVLGCMKCLGVGPFELTPKQKLRAELMGLELPQLTARALESHVSAPDMAAAMRAADPKAALIELIIDAELVRSPTIFTHSRA